jgi:hypothetical protein
MIFETELLLHESSETLMTINRIRRKQPIIKAYKGNEILQNYILKASGLKEKG